MFDQLMQNIRDTPLAEWLAVAASVAYVVLAARENAWCWIFGLIASALYSWLFFEATLYLDSGLQIYYVAVAVYGWLNWRRKENNNSPSLKIHRGSFSSLILLTIAPALLTIPMAILLRTYTPSQAPWADAALTLFSLSATWMTTRKILESWIFWIIIDTAYIFLLFSRSMPMSALLYFIYTIIAVTGFFSWRKQISR